MLDYILFEKKSENDRPVWSEELIKTFCDDQKIDYKEIKEETLFFVVRTAEEEREDDHYRLLEVTPTITFILKDDKSLDEILELEVPDIKNLKIEEGDEKDD